MSSPLRMFRKHQKKLIVIFGVLLMLSFTVFGSVGITQALLDSDGGGTGKAVAKWKGGEITKSEIDGLRFGRHWVNVFLEAIVPDQVREQANGLLDAYAQQSVLGQFQSSPQMMSQLMRNQQLFEMFRQQAKQQLLNQNPFLPRQLIQEASNVSFVPLVESDEELARTYLLAKKAEEMGMVIGDDTINDYLNLVSQANPKNLPGLDSYRARFEQVSNRRVSWRTFLDQMRLELMAINMRKMAGFNFDASGVSTPFVVLPDRYAELNDRIRHQVRAEVIEYKAEDFLDRVVNQPSESEIKKIYEEGKDRFPNPNDPEAGFKRRLRIMLEYFEGKLDDFVKAEMPNIKADDVKEHYEKNKDSLYSQTVSGPQADGATGKKVPKPLAEVEEEIRKTLAEEPAKQKLAEAINAATQQIDSYRRSHTRWGAEKVDNPNAPEPKMPDWKSVAEQLGLTYGTTDGLVEAKDLTDNLQFAQSAFKPDLRLWKPETNPEFQQDRYVFWKSKQEKEHTPKLEKVRNEVVKVWKQRQALELAKQEAKATSEKARKSPERLKEQFGDRVKQTNEFSWYTMASPNMGMSQGSLTNSVITGVDQAGDDFKRKVFSLGVGEVDVAVNYPKTAAYVVRILYETRSKEDRTRELLSSGPPHQTIRQLASVEESEGYSTWIESVEKEMQFEWIAESEE